MNQYSRRGFLKGAAALGAVGLLSGCQTMAELSKGIKVETVNPEKLVYLFKDLNGKILAEESFTDLNPEYAENLGNFIGSPIRFNNPIYLPTASNTFRRQVDRFGSNLNGDDSLVKVEYMNLIANILGDRAFEDTDLGERVLSSLNRGQLTALDALIRKEMKGQTLDVIGMDKAMPIYAGQMFTRTELYNGSPMPKVASLDFIAQVGGRISGGIEFESDSQSKAVGYALSGATKSSSSPIAFTVGSVTGANAEAGNDSGGDGGSNGGGSSGSGSGGSGGGSSSGSGSGGGSGGAS